MRSHLLEGTVAHHRADPAYHLRHDVYYLALDLDELDEAPARIRMLGRNRRNVLEFRDADHWPAPASDLRATVLDHLREQGQQPEGWRITLVTNVRVLGYVFNPASFYLCRDREGRLQVVVVEVHNTHGERHLYTLQPGQSGGRFVASMAKDFYVSPFIDMEGRYTVHVQDGSDGLRIAINERRDDRPVLATSLVLARKELTNRTVLSAFLRYPLVTHKTIALIHLHALRLWRRGVPFNRHGSASAASRGSGGGAVAAGPHGQAVL